MDATLLLDLYRQMCLSRRFEEAAAKAYSQGKVSGFLHLYIGQEAVAVGAISAAEPTDYIVATYREHAHYLARTDDARGAMAELFGRATGCSGGRGGSMHLFEQFHTTINLPGDHRTLANARKDWIVGRLRSSFTIL